MFIVSEWKLSTMKGDKLLSKSINVRDFEKILKDNGYSLERQKGDHMIYYKGNSHVSFPLRKLNPMFIRRLVKEYNLVV